MKRIVLVKPGDVLFIGNVGTLDEADVEGLTAAVKRVKDAAGLSEVFIFEADIDIAASDGSPA